MRVSVIVPTRNRAELLARAVAGVASQDHPDVELIVVDDASAPEQAALNEQVARTVPGSLYILLQPTDAQGSGPSRVRNIGIEAATGELVAFCDDDDHWCAADWLATAAAAFAGQPGLDLLFGNQEAVASGVTRYATWQPKLESAVASRAAGALAPVSSAECLVSAGDFAHLNTCIFRKTLLAAIGGFHADLRYSEDLDLYVRAVDRARAVAYLRRTVAIHRVPDRSRRENASTRLDARAKNVTLHLIASRLFASCASPQALDYARRLGAQACRTLARQAAAAARGDEALTWARLAGAWRQTMRWAVYTQWLGLRRAAFADAASAAAPQRRAHEKREPQLPLE